jgi:hypothetical protein
MLERDVEIGQDLARARQGAVRGHMLDHAVHMRIGIDVMESHPGAERTQFARQIGHVRAHRPVAVLALGMLQVDAVSACILGDNQKFLRPGRDQPFGLIHNPGGRTASEPSAHRRDDAETAIVVAAFRDLYVGVMTRRQLDALGRGEIDQRIVRGGQRLVHGLDHLLVLVRAGDGQHVRMDGADRRLVRAHAAGHDHAAVLGQRLADRLQRFRLGAVEEAAGIDQHHVGAVVVRRDRVALGAQLGQDAFAVDQGLRAAEADHPHPRGRAAALRARGTCDVRRLVHGRGI